ncbi:MAG: PrsW family glutamic-type intramembrane protease, partial [candidate division WOR-3 bacterium]
MIIGLLLLAIGPPLALLLFFYFRDRYKKEPLWPLLVTFLLGAFVVLPSSASSLTLGRLTGLARPSLSLTQAFWRALLLAGLVEEFWKFLVVRVYAYARPEFDEPYDGIMYSITAALGFATVENILYIFGPASSPFIGDAVRVGVMRAVLAVPGHAFYGVLMGYFLGEAKFARPGHTLFLTLTGLGLAILAHGVYDFIAFSIYQRPLL